MPSRGLHPDTKLSITLGCMMVRSKYTTDPTPVIAELYDAAGGRADLLAFEVGKFLASMDHTPEGPYCTTLTDALRALDLDTTRGYEVTRANILTPVHSTRGFAGS